MKKGAFQLIPCMLLGAAMFTGCSNNDIYDPNYLQQLAKETFPVKNIDPNQTWQMVGTTTAKVTVNEISGDTYTIKIYDKDPIGGSSASLLGKGTVVSGNTWTGTIDYPLADTTLYVACVDSKARREVIPTKFTNGGSVNIVFGSSDTKTRALTRAVGDFTDPDIAAKQSEPYSATTINTMLSQATDISTVSGNDIANNGTNTSNYYKITGDATYNVTAGNPKTGTKIIVQGTWTPNWQSLNDGIEVIVADGGKIILTNALTSNATSGNGITVLAGGSITGSGSLVFNGKNTCYNGGTINLSSVTFSPGGTIYNAGTLTLSDALTLNTGANLINYGTFSMPSGVISVPAGGYTFNADGASLNVNSLLLNTSAVFINHSSICVLGSANGSNDNANFYNSCKMTVNGTLNLSNLIQSAGGSVQCKDLILHSATVDLGANSILKATNTTSLQSCTVSGPTDGLTHAICFLGNVNQDGYGPKNEFSNSLYVDVTSHPTDQYGWWNQTVTFDNGAVEVGSNEANYPIPSSSCSIGYDPTGTGGGGTDTPQIYTYAFEDMTKTVGDYDFNDVVLKVSAPIDGKVTVKLVAAGATKNLKVHFNNTKANQDIALFDDKEVHEAMGATAGTMINTGKGTGSVVSQDINVGSDFMIKDNGDFYIVDTSNNNEVHIPKFTDGFKAGDVPYAVCVPKDWQYPLENIEVMDAYSNFATWAQDVTKDLDWYSSPDASKIYK